MGEIKSLVLDVNLRFESSSSAGKKLQWEQVLGDLVLESCEQPSYARPPGLEMPLGFPRVLAPGEVAQVWEWGGGSVVGSLVQHREQQQGRAARASSPGKAAVSLSSGSGPEAAGG